jgi:hypothetical protein
MIWALLAAYFLGGGLGAVHGGLLTSAGVKELSAQAEVIIGDSQRAEAAAEILQALRKEIGRFERTFARSGRQMVRYYRSHEANEQQMLAALQALNAEWEAVEQEALDLRFQLREQMTEGEWAELYPSR